MMTEARLIDDLATMHVMTDVARGETGEKKSARKLAGIGVGWWPPRERSVVCHSERGTRPCPRQPASLQQSYQDAGAGCHRDCV